MDSLSPWLRHVIHWAHQGVDQRHTLVVEYTNFQDLIPWRTHARIFYHDT